VALLGGSTALAQAINVALAPVLTRLYSPADIGRLGLFTSFLNVAIVGVSFKYELGIVSAESEAEAARLTWAAILLAVPASIFAAAILWGMMRGAYFGFGTLPEYAVVLMIAALLLTAIYVSLRYWAIRQASFGVIARTSLAQQATRAASQTALGFSSAGALGLFLSELFGRTAGVMTLLRNAWPAMKTLGIKSPPDLIIRDLKRNRKLPMFSFPSSLIDTLAANMLLPVLIGLYGSEAGGQFALVQKVLAVPVVLIADSVADTFHSRLAVCAREEPRKMLVLFNRTTAGLLLASLLPAAILTLGGGRMFAFVFGKPWATAGALAAISTPFLLSQMVVSPLSRLVFVLRGQEYKLIYDLFVMAGILATFKIAAGRGLSLPQTVLAFTVVNTSAYIVYFFVLRRIVIKAAAASHEM
jgi:lipopolysaccharide exporter